MKNSLFWILSVVLTAFSTVPAAAQYDHDLVAAEISAPESVEPGSDFNVTVMIVNEGLLEAENFKVELYEFADLVETKTVEKLEPGADIVLTFPQTMSELAVYTLYYKAAIVYGADENVENNETDEIVVTPVVTLPGVKNFIVEGSWKGNILVWQEPDLLFTSASGEEIQLEFKGCEVYRDGEKISGDELVVENKFLDVDSKAGIGYEYAVVAVFDLGKGTPAFCEITGIDDVTANVVITTSDSNIVVLGADGLEVTVCAVAGKALFTGKGTPRTVVPVSTGIYIVRAGTKVAKVVVM